MVAVFVRHEENNESEGESCFLGRENITRCRITLSLEACEVESTGVKGTQKLNPLSRR